MGAVETGRRARAGRTAFMRDTREALEAPRLPLETGKLTAHPASWSGAGVHGPFPHLLPPVPLHEVFERAATRA